MHKVSHIITLSVKLDSVEAVGEVFDRVLVTKEKSHGYNNEWDQGKKPEHVNNLG